MNNKGFTLIELLAVIVILAIIALIATPIVLNIIADAQKSGIDRTAELVGSEMQVAFAHLVMADNSKTADNFCDYMVADHFTMDGASIKTACATVDSVPTVVIEAGNTDYTVTYVSSTGIATIAYSGGENETKTVQMK